ncbi:MAG: winged helix-turn-helix domain-containing protein [Mariprofundaceae bacterium]|nr:winged helix-turn-helix domain-containing protein [Mariprofundaceae bacterium]
MKEEDIITMGIICLDPVGHLVTVHGEPAHMGATDFRLLKFFLTHADRVFTRKQLLLNVWGKTVKVDVRTVDVHIRRLRKALSSHGYDHYIQTVRTVGYRFSM